MIRTLIRPEALHTHLGQPGWILLDCRFDLAAPDRFREETFPGGHIPGAVYADLERDLSGRATGRNGRHPLPSADQLVQRFSAWGIDSRAQVVAYDDNAGYAARAWWLLRYMGHAAAAMLDGGLPAWTALGYPLAHTSVAPTPAIFRGAPRPEMVLSATEVLTAARLLDARAPERFRGEVEPIDPVAGHIPGARNYPWATSLGEAGRHVGADPLRDQLLAVLDGVDPSLAVAYCGSGVTACNIILAMEHAGLSGVRLYPGSWSEWCSDPARPIETGESLR
jgi:thiosulfate/3-mercaptopyruvate sulfurtransferase